MGEKLIQFTGARVEFDLEVKAIGDGQQFTVVSPRGVLTTDGFAIPEKPSAHLRQAAGSLDQVGGDMAAGPAR